MAMGGIVGFLLIFVFGYYIGGGCNKYSNYNPTHATNGIDTVFSDNTYFVIKVEILKAVEKETEQGKDDPR